MNLDRLVVDILARLCKASSDPLRLMILRVLSNNSFGVLELTQLFETTQSGMSHHLKILLQANLVTTRREGNTIFYRRALAIDHSLVSFHQALLNEVDKLEIPNGLQQNINSVYAERAELSRIFFTNFVKADGLTQQDVIVGLGHYQETVLKLLDNQYIGKNSVVLEVGPGEGKFIPELAKRFTKVLAVDNSAEMLQLVKTRCLQQNLKNVILHKVDVTCLELAEPVDCIVANMVLHHLPAPAEAFKKFKQCLNSKGSLLLTELCQHEQDWVTSVCGDLWLGFDPDELNHWAIVAGFKPDESLFIGLRNGFQLQIRRFSVID